MDPHDDPAMAHAIEHRRKMRLILGAEKRVRTAKGNAKAKAKPLSPDRVDAILAAVVTAFPNRRDRPTVKQIAKACGVSPNWALEARRVLCVADRWPFPDQRAEIIGRIERSRIRQESPDRQKTIC